MINKANKYVKISLSNNDLLPLETKKNYINSMYPANPAYNDTKRNIGFVNKFNNSIGFKDTISICDNYGVVKKVDIDNPENYIPPNELIFKSITTPIDTFSIMEFYIPVTFIEHSNQKFSYHTINIALKWASFLQKIFPNLFVDYKVVNGKPTQLLRDYALEYFYRNISKDTNYTIEFNAPEKLSDEDINYIVHKIQTLTDTKIVISQYICDVCSEYSNGKKSIHIEIVYLTWCGNDAKRKQNIRKRKQK